MALGIVGIGGCLAAAAGNIIGSIVVPNHDWISDTISDLAAGRYEIIQDAAMYGFAASLIACALGAAHLHRGGWRWNTGTFSLSFLAACVIIIGARNEYGDNDDEGFEAHIYLVYALGLLFAAVFFAMAECLSDNFPWFRKLSYGCGILWVIGCPFFMMMSTSWDGAFERGLGLILLVWTSAFSLILFLTGKYRHDQAE